MRNKIISMLFCLLLIGFAAAHLLLADRYFSEAEKRTLKQFPKLSWTAVRSGKFGDEIERYLADQFPGRDAWVTVKTLSERLSGKKESGGVYFADDGYLIKIHTGFDRAQTETNLAALKRLRDAMAERGVPVRVMLVPTAGQILADKLPACAPYADEQAVLDAAKALGLELCDVTEALAAHKDEEIYYRTDHHWTSLGA